MSNPDNMVARRADPAEVTSRFQALVQSPLRAAILRFICARPDEAFDVEALMQTFGRMRLDVENCVRELAAFGIAKKSAGARSPWPTPVMARRISPMSSAASRLRPKMSRWNS
jgi:hypothetical protein